MVSPSLSIRYTHPNAPPSDVAKTKRNATAKSTFPAKVCFAGSALGLSNSGARGPQEGPAVLWP